MTADAWIALASLAGFILVQTVILAFMAGGLFQRVKALEARPTDNDCKTELALLTLKFETMKDTLDGLAEDIKNLLGGKPATVARRSRGADA